MPNTKDFKPGSVSPSGGGRPTTRRERASLNAVVSANRRGLIGEKKSAHVDKVRKLRNKADSDASKAKRRRKLTNAATKVFGGRE